MTLRDPTTDDSAGAMSPTQFAEVVRSLRDASGSDGLIAGNTLSALRPPAPWVADELLRLLRSTEAEERAAALKACAYVRSVVCSPSSSTFLEAVTSGLSGDDSEDRATMARVCGALRYQASTPAIRKALVKLLRDPVPCVRAAGAFACGHVLYFEPHRQRATAALRALVTDCEPGVRSEAVFSLASLARDGRLSDGSLCVTRALGDPAAEVRGAAIQGVSMLEAPAIAPECFSVLSRLLRHQDHEVRLAAADACCAFGPDLQVEDAIHDELCIGFLAAIREGDPRLRCAVIRAARRWSPMQAELAVALIEACGDHPHVDRAVADTFGRNWHAERLGDPRCMSAVATLLRDARPLARGAGARLCAHVAPPLVLPDDVQHRLIEMLGNGGAESSGEAAVIVAAAVAVKTQCGADASRLVEPAILGLLSAGDNDLVKQGLEACRELGRDGCSPDVVRRVARILCDPSADCTVRRGALSTCRSLTVGVSWSSAWWESGRGYGAWYWSQPSLAAAVPVLLEAMPALLADAALNDWGGVTDLCCTLEEAAGRPEILAALAADLRRPYGPCYGSRAGGAAHACRLIGKTAGTPEVVAALAYASSDPDSLSSAAPAAIAALGILGKAALTEDVRNALIEALAGRNEEARRAAVDACRALGPELATPTFCERLVVLVDHRSPDSPLYTTFPYDQRRAAEDVCKELARAGAGAAIEAARGRPLVT